MAIAPNVGVQPSNGRLSSGFNGPGRLLTFGAYSPPIWQPVTMPPIDQYSSLVAGNRVIQFRKVPPQSERNYDWYFVHRGNAPGGVRVLTLINRPKQEPLVHFLVTRRPPLGGRLSIELPAGLWADSPNHPNESPLDAAKREVLEETGMPAQSVQLLSAQPYSPLPGLTSELGVYALATTNMMPPSIVNRPKDEQALIVGHLNIPLSTFTRPDRFQQWLQEVHGQGYLVTSDILAARGLLPSSFTRPPSLLRRLWQGVKALLSPSRAS